jgi:hypothetical protein
MLTLPKVVAGIAVLVFQYAAGQETARMQVGTNFWNIAWGNAWKDYFREGVNWQTTTNPWRGDFIRDITGYAALRFMDWVPTNNSPCERWSDRISRTTDHYRTPGVAYEWQIDLCNRANADIWLTVPHKTFNDWQRDPANCYWRQLARLVKNSLRPELKVYLEYSNETWNAATPFIQQYDYCNSKGVETGVGGGPKFHAYAAIKMIEIFKEEFADQPHRLKTMFASFLFDDWRTREMIAVMKDTRWNPKGTMPDYVALANYIGGCDGTMTDAQLETCWNKTKANHISKHDKHLSYLAGTGIKLIGYEGGTDIHNAGFFRRNPLSYRLYKEMLEAWDKQMVVWMQYTHTGRWFQWSNPNQSDWAWGVLDYTGQDPQSSHTYRALFDWIKAHNVRPQSTSVTERTVTKASPLRISGTMSPTLYSLAGREITIQAGKSGVCIMRLDDQRIIRVQGYPSTVR